MLEIGVLKITLDLPLLHGVEPQRPRRSRPNMLAISLNRYVFCSFFADVSPLQTSSRLCGRIPRLLRQDDLMAPHRLSNWVWHDPPDECCTNVTHRCVSSFSPRFLIANISKRVVYGGSATTNPHYSSRPLCADTIPYSQSCALPHIHDLTLIHGRMTHSLESGAIYCLCVLIFLISFSVRSDHGPNVRIFPF
jgi:hypothetical protein